MEQIRSGARRFFTGVRLLLPLLPSFVVKALSETYQSTVDYWKGSQSIVDKIAHQYMHEVMQADEHLHAVMQEGETIGEYDNALYWVCYSIASLLYLLGWLAMSWITVELLHQLTSRIF